MTRAEARAVLNAARDGAAVSRRRIDLALHETGDLARPGFAATDDLPVVRSHRPVGSWERRNLAAPLLLRAGPFDGLGA